MTLNKTTLGSPRYFGLQAVSPVGRTASGPWSGPFGRIPSASESEGLKTLYINPLGQCFGDLKGGAVQLVYSESNLIEHPLSDSSSDEAPESPVLDLATLMGIHCSKKGHNVPTKEKPAKLAAASGPRCSNKLRRTSHGLQQPRRLN